MSWLSIPPPWSWDLFVLKLFFFEDTGVRPIDPDPGEGRTILQQIISDNLREFVKIQPNGEIQLNMSEQLSVTLWSRGIVE